MEIRFVIGNLTKMEVEAIVNPANSEGEMGGGVAAAIKRSGGKAIEDEAMQKAPIPIGSAILTDAGRLPCQFVIHSPTMKMPVQRTSTENIGKALLAALWIARDYGIASLAVPGMGTGTGRVDVHDAAEAMIAVVRKVEQGIALKELIFVDQNKAMVAAWESCWAPPPVEEEQSASDTGTPD